MKVSGYEGYEGVCNSILVYEMREDMRGRRACQILFPRVHHNIMRLCATVVLTCLVMLAGIRVCV